jgi:hypothetical protein
MSTSARIAGLLWLAAVAAGCSRKTQDATQVIVIIDAEPNVRARTASLRIQVRGLPALAADAWDSDQTLDADLDQLLLPYSLALVPKNGDASRKFEVLVTARTAPSGPGGLERFVSVSRTVSGYRAHRRLLLEVMLSDDCIYTIACGPEQTCKAARCAPASVDPASLPEFPATTVPEASVSKPEDAGVELPPPPMPDAGQDAAVDPACPNGQCCDEGDTIECGATTGACALGIRTCVNNLWGPCIGQISPTEEICNDDDDDCDGNTDEAVVCDPRDIPHSQQAACIKGVPGTNQPPAACVSIECEPHYGDCDSAIEGCEQLLNEVYACGECGVTCETPNASPTCETGECRVHRCYADYGDCDDNPADCETPLDTTDDCGACNQTCERDNAATVCGGGLEARVCELTSCDDNFADCNEDLDDGCETDLDSDNHNCGACGNDCPSSGHLDSAECVAGQCIFDCQDSFADCDGIESNGCEQNLAVDGPGPCYLRCFQQASDGALDGASNVALDGYGYPTAVDINCPGPHTFNSSTGLWDTNCCGSCPDVTGPVAIAASDPVYILRAERLNVAADATVKLIGAYPVIIAVQNSATIAGTIDASAVTTVPGAGGSSSLSCDSSANGGPGTGQEGAYTILTTRGGGGGGFGTRGGLGGGVSSSTVGKANGESDLTPLRGGCSGGKGAKPTACPDVMPAAGAGGGALQLSVAGKLTITATGSLLANGGVGSNGIVCSSGSPTYTAGSGGGSGGAILLEASGFSMPALDSVAHTYGATGGSSSTGQAGGVGATNSATDGAKGALLSSSAAGGGGGGHGRVFVRSCVGP